MAMIELSCDANGGNDGSDRKLPPRAVLFQGHYGDKPCPFTYSEDEEEPDATLEISDACPYDKLRYESNEEPEDEETEERVFNGSTASSTGRKRPSTYATGRKKHISTGLWKKSAKAARGGESLPRAQLRVMGWNPNGRDKNRLRGAPSNPRMRTNLLHLINKCSRGGEAGSKTSTTMKNCDHCFLAASNAEGGLKNSAIVFSFCSNMCTTKYGRPQKKVRCKCYKGSCSR